MLLIDALRQAGWPESELGNCLGIINHESGGDPNARCHDCFPGITEDSRGLFQINVDAHTQWAGLDLSDPVVNAKCALQLYQGAGNYRDWSTTAQSLGIAPYGSNQHAVSEFAALANKDVAGGGGSGGGSGQPSALPSSGGGKALVIGGLVVLAAWIFLD